MEISSPTLVILAAGMASRYGGNKQTEGFGPNGETIMEYAIYDAIEAGFGKIVFIIREEFAEGFRAAFEHKLAGRVATSYVYQHLDSLSGGRSIPPERTKPFGTQHALLCAKEALDGPFAVINADDFYGRDAFVKAHHFLTQQIDDHHFACIGYRLSNTLSSHGAVTRGEIMTSGQEITRIVERKEIFMKDGAAYAAEGSSLRELPPDTNVSMNFFCFTPHFLEWSAPRYGRFLDEKGSDLKAEFLIPEVVDLLIMDNEATVELIKTNSRWFGVTFKADAAFVREELAALIANGTYPRDLWAQPQNILSSAY